MEIRAAILAAADYIERNPQDFNYESISIPGRPRKRMDWTPTNCGCAIGWTMALSGTAADSLSLFAVESLGCEGAAEFYIRMGDLAPGWERSAPLCVKAMRLYADKYHPAPVDSSDTRTQQVEQRNGFDWEALAQRLASEPRAQGVAASIS